MMIVDGKGEAGACVPKLHRRLITGGWRVLHALTTGCMTAAAVNFSPRRVPQCREDTCCPGNPWLVRTRVRHENVSYSVACIDRDGMSREKTIGELRHFFTGKRAQRDQLVALWCSC